MTVIYLATVTGCAMVSHDRLPKYSYSQIEKHEKKISIDYDYSFDTSNMASVFRDTNFGSIMENSLNESGVFEKVYKGTGNEKYHMSIMLGYYGRNKAMEFLNIELSALSLMVIPHHSKHNFVMTVDVSKDGDVIKTYKYDDGYSIWVQLFLMFYPDFRGHKEMQEEVMNNIVRNFLYDLQKDAILQ
jgi:hypothetical protein